MCSFSEQGTFIFAGSNDCCVYVWHWDLDVEHLRRCGDESSALITGDMNLSNGSSPPAEEEESMRYAYLLPFYPASYCAKGISVTCQPFAFCLKFLQYRSTLLDQAHEENASWGFSRLSRHELELDGRLAWDNHLTACNAQASGYSYANWAHAL